MRTFVKKEFFSVQCAISEVGPYNGGKGAVVVAPGNTKSVDSAINHFFARRLKQAIQIRRKRIFRRIGIPELRNNQTVRLHADARIIR